MSFAIALHAIAAVIWVGGMAFAFFALRPVVAQRLGNQRRLLIPFYLHGKDVGHLEPFLEHL